MAARRPLGFMGTFEQFGVAMSETGVADEALPAVVTAQELGGSAERLIAWIADHRREVKELVNDRGAVLFRGFSFQSAGQFQAACKAFAPELAHYVGGGSPRSIVSGNVYTSTEYPSQEHIPLHIEASYLPDIPRYIFFMCLVAPTDRGQTPLGDMRDVLNKIDHAVRDRFTSRGVRYINNMHGGKGFGKSWQQTFMTEDRAAVEAKLGADGYDYRWKPDGGLMTVRVGPAVAVHPSTGRAFWCNQAVNWHASGFDPVTRQALRRLYGAEERFPKHATFGDGGPIPDDDCTHIRRVLAEAEQEFRWHSGDVLFCDNHAVAHGRQPFSGARRVLVAMA